MNRHLAAALAAAAGIAVGLALIPVSTPLVRRLVAGEAWTTGTGAMPALAEAQAFLTARAPRPRWPTGLPDGPWRGGVWAGPDGRDLRDVADSAAWDWARHATPAFPGVRERTGAQPRVLAWERQGDDAVRAHFEVPAGLVWCDAGATGAARVPAALQLELRRDGGRWRVRGAAYPDCTLADDASA